MQKEQKMLLSLAFPKNLFLQNLEPTYSINREIQNNPIICKYISKCLPFANGMPILTRSSII